MLMILNLTSIEAVSAPAESAGLDVVKLLEVLALGSAGSRVLSSFTTMLRPDTPVTHLTDVLELDTDLRNRYARAADRRRRRRCAVHGRCRACSSLEGAGLYEPGVRRRPRVASTARMPGAADRRVHPLEHPTGGRARERDRRGLLDTYAVWNLGDEVQPR